MSSLILKESTAASVLNECKQNTNLKHYSKSERNINIKIKTFQVYFSEVAMEPHVINRSTILKNLDSCVDASSSNITLVCSNGKFKVNPILVAGIYYLFEQVLLTLSDTDEGPRPTVLTIPDIETEFLESSFLNLYQQLNEEPISLTIKGCVCLCVCQLISSFLN